MSSLASLKDFRVRLIPDEKLRNFLQTLHDEKGVPIRILAFLNKDAIKNNISPENVDKIPSKKGITTEMLKLLRTLNNNNKDQNTENITNLDHSGNESEDFIDGKQNKSEEKRENKTNENNSRCNSKDRSSNNCLELSDIIWLHDFLAQKRKDGETDTYFLHELLENCELILPENEIIPRNPELEARCEKLRRELNNKEYHEMVKNVDVVKKNAPQDTIAYQVKSINRQLVAVMQFIFSVAAGFAFGFIGIELIIGNLDFGFRLLLGIICALIIALAEIYFLAKKLNEFDDIDYTKFPTKSSSNKIHTD